MIVGVLQVELCVDDSRSLKDKRRVVKSIKDRLHREHMVSVAEIGQLDDHRLATLGIVLASKDVSVCQSVLDRILDKLRAARDCHMTDHAVELLTGQNAKSSQA